MAVKPSKGIKKLTDEDVIRIARISATQGAAAAYVETEHDTQLSIERGVIWLIHGIEFEAPPSLDDAAQGDTEVEHFHIAKASDTAIMQINDPNLIASYKYILKRWATIGTDAGPAIVSFDQIKRITFPSPIPFASQNIYFAYQSTQAAAKTAYARILYSLGAVSDAYFYRVAQALIS